MAIPIRTTVFRRTVMTSGSSSGIPATAIPKGSHEGIHHLPIIDLAGLDLETPRAGQEGLVSSPAPNRQIACPQSTE